MNIDKPLLYSKFDLTNEVINKIGNPIDYNSVLITLEMLGITDFLSQDKYDKNNLRELADEIYRRAKVLVLRKEKTIYKEKHPVLMSIKRFFSSFLKGTEIAIPMIIQMISIGLIGVSLWAYLGFTSELATYIAIGTFLSYVVTGGFMQSIGRKGLQYLAWDNPPLAKKGVYKIYRGGAYAVLIIGLLFALIIWLINSFSLNRLILITLSYYFMLSFLWLNLSVLYVSKKILGTIISTSLPIIVILILLAKDINIIPAQIAGLFVSNVISFFWGYISFYRLPPTKEKLLKSVKLPPVDWFKESIKKYFLFGLFYFTFLMTDRIVNWTSSFSRNGMLFNSSYEIGLDFALIFFPIFLILAEYAMRVIFGRIIYLQKNLKSTEIEKYNIRFFIYYIIIFCAIPAISMLIYVFLNPIFYVLYNSFGFEILGPLFNDNLTKFVFNASYYAYIFTGIGLFNSLLLISHSRPEMPLNSILVAFFTNIIVGILLSRLISPEYSVFGLLLGGIVFFVTTTIASANLMMDFDYATFYK